MLNSFPEFLDCLLREEELIGKKVTACCQSTQEVG